eukprot:9132811-Pyramimonas_sp.AAC.1
MAMGTCCERLQCVLVMVFLFFLHLPHKCTCGKTKECFRATLCMFHGVLRDIALNVQSFRRRFHCEEALVGVDAQVEARAHVSHGGREVAGASVGSPVPPSRGRGTRKPAGLLNRECSEALTCTIGALGLQLSNTFGSRGSPTWKSSKWNHCKNLDECQRFEHVYDYFATPISWGCPEVVTSWLEPSVSRGGSRPAFWSDHAMLTLQVPAR